MSKKDKEILELKSVILAAINCETHFHKPRIIERDKDFRLGKRAKVICQACVVRMEKILGLPEGETPPFGQYFNGREQEELQNLER